MNSKLLAVLMIAGLLFSAGSVFLNHAVFADDPWSDIAARQQAAEQKAMTKYMSMYQFANMDQSMRNWSGLTNTTESPYVYKPGSTTDETSRGRTIDAQQQVSLQNAVAYFDTIHSTQLEQLRASDYKGLNSTTTDTQGRDRNAMIDSVRASSLASADDIMSQLVKVQQTYADFQAGPTTDSAATYDRQTMINQNAAASESQAADLVSELAKRYQVFLDLTPYVNTNIPYTYKPGSITNEMTHGGRNLTPQEAYSLEKAVMIFNEIHQSNLASLKSKWYGLTSTSTDTQGRDRNTLIAQAQQSSMNNALNVFNSYYPASTR
ncbi:MAG: hypothetical protein KGI28_06250 [Thaumarchaeota archaeon]|nr:hypothetical protein [Nitrososphaerota archaeon]